MLRLLFSLLFMMQASQTALHPTLTLDEAALMKAWKGGYERAKTDKTLYRAHKFAQRGIGSINNKTVSWVLWVHPRLRAFERGFNARKENATEEEQANSQRGLSRLAEEGTRTLRFHCELGIYPRLGNGIMRVADIRDLNGVSAELRVGDRVYRPLRQPGDLEPQVLTDVHKWTERVKVRTRRSKKDDDSRERESDYIELPRQVEYRYYTGTFDLVFDLWEEDETPRLTDKDTEFIVMVTGKFGSQKATYRLKDWLNAYEK
jgi:hypothetical protein